MEICWTAGVMVVVNVAVMTTTTALVSRFRDRLTRIEPQQCVHVRHVRPLAPK